MNENKKKYTVAQIEAVDRRSILEFLRSQPGEVVFKKYGEYRWERHDSVVIDENKNVWCQHSKGTKDKPLGGGFIKFLMEFYGMTFREVMEEYCGLPDEHPEPHNTVNREGGSTRKKKFCLPQRNGSIDLVIRYLTQVRRISLDVLRPFIESGDLYAESYKGHTNMIVLGRDPDGIPRSAERKGLSGSYRYAAAGSDKKYCFHQPGTDSTLCIFEAPIDLLSFITLYPKAKSSFLLATGGCTNYKAVTQFLEDHPQIRTVYLCLDHDEPGQEACDHMEQSLPAAYTVGRLVPALKDWNDILRSETPVPAPYTLKYR